MLKKDSRKIKPVFSRSLNPVKRQESHGAREDENSCCQSKKKIPLKGLSHFAKVGKSRRCLRRLIKLSVVSICTAGFFYQIWSFLLIYLTYPTVQDESEEHVDSFSLPAITICNRNRYSRLLYCGAYPHLCSWNLTTWETFCATYRKQCPETKPPDFNFGIPQFKYQLERDNLTDFLKVAGQETDLGFILKCSVYGFALNKTCNSSIVIQVMNHGIPYNCFSLFSLLGKQYDESLKVTLTDNYEIHMDLHPEEYINPYDKVQASVVIHDPRKLVNPMLEGVTLSAGKTYMLYPTMEMRKSLPSPYASECIDYLDEWKKNGGRGPLSKHDCIDACKIKAMIKKYGCVLRSMTYPNNYSVCAYHRIYTVSSEVSRRCASICQDACKETIYHLTSEHLVNVQGTCNSTDEHCKNRFLYIYVNFDRMRVQKLQQLPRFESIELLGYIGGYLGMWLGVSLVSLFDFAEVIYDIVYPSLKGKRTQKTTTSAVKFLHQTT